MFPLMSLTREELQALITGRDFDSLIGQVEGHEFECKDQPYRIDTDAGKRELAKDVSSFANANGGFIFIGVKTKPSSTHFGDEIDSIRGLEQSLLNTSQYVDLLRIWVFPEVTGLAISWIPISGTEAKGLVIIDIPKQAVGAGPFLITKTLDGAKAGETIFGLATRKGDRNPPLDAKELQRYLRSGLDYHTRIEKRLEAIEAIVKTGAEAAQQEAILKGKSEQIEVRIGRAIEHGDLKSRRLFVISAQPMEPKELRTIFVSGQDSIKRRLESPPTIRQNGWTLETLDQARIVRGEFIRVTNGDRKVVDLYRDSTLVFAAPADNEFLAWASKGKPRINPLALAEVVLSFTSFYSLVISDFVSIPKQVRFRVDLRSMHFGSIKNTLVPGSLQSISWIIGADEKEAPDNQWTSTFDMATADFDPSATGYNLVREIYLWFGIDESHIPYAKEEDGTFKLDQGAMVKSSG